MIASDAAARSSAVSSPGLLKGFSSSPTGAFARAEIMDVLGCWGHFRTSGSRRLLARRIGRCALLKPQDLK